MSDDILKLCFNSMLTTKPLYWKRPTINNTDQEYISWSNHSLLERDDYVFAWQSSLTGVAIEGTGLTKQPIFHEAL